MPSPDVNTKTNKKTKKKQKKNTHTFSGKRDLGRTNICKAEGATTAHALDRRRTNEAEEDCRPQITHRQTSFFISAQMFRPTQPSSGTPVQTNRE
jgi:hypothetical protein